MRLIFLSTLLVAALIALDHRSSLQAWASGSARGVGSLQGAPAPELPGLRALRGRVVVVHFWTFGCSNCRHMLPRYAEWLDRYGARGLSVIGVHTPEMDYERDPAALARFVRDEKIRWPVVVDPDEAIWQRYRVAAWPTIVLVDRAGVVRATFVGDDRSSEIEDRIREIISH